YVKRVELSEVPSAVPVVGHGAVAQVTERAAARAHVLSTAEELRGAALARRSHDEPPTPVDGTEDFGFPRLQSGDVQVSPGRTPPAPQQRLDTGRAQPAGLPVRLTHEPRGDQCHVDGAGMRSAGLLPLRPEGAVTGRRLRPAT